MQEVFADMELTPLDQVPQRLRPDHEIQYTNLACLWGAPRFFHYDGSNTWITDKERVFEPSETVLRMSILVKGEMERGKALVGHPGRGLWEINPELARLFAVKVWVLNTRKALSRKEAAAGIHLVEAGVRKEMRAVFNNWATAVRTLNTSKRPEADDDINLRFMRSGYKIHKAV